MQVSVPEVMDITRESQQTLEAYGAEPGRVELRQQLPARPPPGRAGRALRAVVRLGLGFPRHRPRRGHPRRLTKKCATMDKPVAALIQDLKAARTAGRDADHLGRRVRPHAVPRRPHRRRRHPRPRPLPRLLHHVAGRRRRESAASPTAKPTNWASRSPATKSTCTTCRPRSCTCLGFDHERLTFRFQGRDYRLTDVHGNVVRELLG